VSSATADFPPFRVTRPFVIHFSYRGESGCGSKVKAVPGFLSHKFSLLISSTKNASLLYFIPVTIRKACSRFQGNKKGEIITKNINKNVTKIMTKM
jgi:hypothetical protein